MKRILVTGITGFIGKATLIRLLQNNMECEITALVRPNTDPSRYSFCSDVVKIEPIDLANSAGLTNYLRNNRFDIILHIGALRGGRKFSNREYYLSNVVSTEIIIESCMRNSTKLIFCSSVGVFGAIPIEVPANNHTTRVKDNYYHYTKIEAEKRINKAVLAGLNAIILRPSITYGNGDFGFPYQLVKMVQKGTFPLINKRIWIHLCHIDTISTAFVWFVLNDYRSGTALNIADREPVQLRDLVNFISRHLKRKNYPALMLFDRKLFMFFEALFKILKNELWVSRVQLISRSWFYDVKELYAIVNPAPKYTIPEIELVIRDFK